MLPDEIIIDDEEPQFNKKEKRSEGLLLFSYFDRVNANCLRLWPLKICYLVQTVTRGDDNINYCSLLDHACFEGSSQKGFLIKINLHTISPLLNAIGLWC